MILDSLLNFNEDTKYTDYEDIVLEADDFGDGTGPSNDDDDEDDYEVTDGDDNSSDNNSNDNTDNSGDADQPDAQSDDDDDYEIQDDDSEQSNVDNSGDDTSTQSDEQNSGDDDNGDDTNQDNNQDSSDATDDQNTDDDSGDDDDDYEIQDDDSDGSDDGGTDANDDGSDSGSDDAESSGDGMDNNGDDPRAKLNELEKSIFDQLPPEQQQAKTLELKGLYQMAFNNCQKIIDSISTTEANPNNTKVFDYIVSRLTDLKGYITDYLNDVFDSKGYLENMTEFQKYLAIFDTIKNTFEEIQKEDNKQE